MAEQVYFNGSICDISTAMRRNVAIFKLYSNVMIREMRKLSGCE